MDAVRPFHPWEWTHPPGRRQFRQSDSRSPYPSSIEEDIYIEVYVPIQDLELAKFDLIKEYAEQGYDIYDKSSAFYNDFCTPASSGDYDITLEDRKNDIYPHNVTLCKSNCIYDGINIEEQRVICKCNLNSDKNEEEVNFVEDDGNFITYFLDNINYKIFKCYKLFFNSNNLKKSFPFYIILIIFLIFQILDSIYVFHTLKRLKIFMAKEMPLTRYSSNIELFVEPKKTNFLTENMKGKEKSNPPTTLSEEIKKTKINKFKKQNVKLLKGPKKQAKSQKNLIIYDSPDISSNKIISKNQKFKKNDVKKVGFMDKIEKKDESEDQFINSKQLKEIKNKEIIKNEVNINELPFSKALEEDKRNLFQIFYSFIIEKFELISIFCNSHRIKIILFVEYVLVLLINFFFNALLYSDDVVSNKYHNNGKLDTVVTLTLSILSNLITSIFCYYIKYSRGIEERINLILEIKQSFHYFRNLKKLFLYLKIKFICFYISQLIILAICIYYIVIFCVLYVNSQRSLIVNYCFSLVESIITSFAVTTVILITRMIGLSCKNKELYNTSKYINEKF